VAGDRFEIKPGALSSYIGWAAEAAGFDIAGGIEASGFVPTFRNLLDATSNYRQYSSHPHHMGTQVAWVVYMFVVPRHGFQIPDGFVPKSIIVEAVDGPYMYEAVRVSLWSLDAAFRVVSNSPIPLDRIKHPEGIPASYAPARWVLDNLMKIIADEANALVPYARAVAAQVV
jgi:hypothetical protein